MSSPTSSSSALFTRQAGALLCILLVWLLPGLLGREPWKPDEAYSFGLIWHLLQGGDWLVPTLAGEPFMEKPPIFFWTAALFAKSWGWLLGPVDAARLATAFYMGVTLFAVGGAARLANGRGQGRWAAVALMGCVGLLIHAHYLITDLALLAGMSLGMLGLLLAVRLSGKAGIALGVGGGLAFMSKGLLGPGILGLTALLLPCLSPEWHTRAYMKVLCVAALVALPWLLIWPGLLWLRQPDLFHEWFWVNNFGRFFGHVHLGPKADPGGYFVIILHFALPVLPLAALTLWRERGQWRSPGLLVPLLSFVVCFAVLQMAADARGLYALPLLPPLALLAARPGRAEDAPVGFMRRYAVLLGFAVIVTLVLLGWLALLYGWPSGALDRLVAARWLAPPQQTYHWSMLLVPVILFGLPWLLARLESAGRQRLLLQWAAGMAMVWSSLVLLYRPWLAQGNDYRGVMHDISSQVAGGGCVASLGLGEPQRALLHYYENLLTARREIGRGADCRLLLTQGDPHSTVHEAPAGWHRIWQGSRPGDRNELLSLFRRD